jgi:ectoine hydroxylase
MIIAETALKVTPLECLPDDCLLKDYHVPLPWKDGTPEAALRPALAA